VISVEITSNDSKYSMNSYNYTPKNIKKNGIPQRAALGLRLVLSYRSNLPQHISNEEVVLFLDDTNILLIHRNINTL
jgi:hypothetical protein